MQNYKDILSRLRFISEADRRVFISQYREVLLGDDFLRFLEQTLEAGTNQVQYVTDDAVGAGFRARFEHEGNKAVLKSVQIVSQQLHAVGI